MQKSPRSGIHTRRTWRARKLPQRRIMSQQRFPSVGAMTETSRGLHVAMSTPRRIEEATPTPGRRWLPGRRCLRKPMRIRAQSPVAIMRWAGQRRKRLEPKSNSSSSRDTCRRRRSLRGRGVGPVGIARLKNIGSRSSLARVVYVSRWRWTRRWA